MKDYKKILEGVVNIIDTTEKSDIGFANICAYIGENCPELKESEDERIRNVLIGWINLEPSISFGDTFDGFSKEQILAWLEKQDKQKPAWSEEDETVLGNLIYALANDKIGNDRDEYVDWLKFIKDRVQPQPKQEWSGGDEAHLHSLITHLEQWIERHPNTTGADIQGENIAWLKSLRPQNHWKLSDEQIKVCKEVYADILSAKGFNLGTVNSELNRLEEELKKLREE